MPLAVVGHRPRRVTASQPLRRNAGLADVVPFPMARPRLTGPTPRPVRMDAYRVGGPPQPHRPVLARLAPSRIDQTLPDAVTLAVTPSDIGRRTPRFRRRHVPMSGLVVRPFDVTVQITWGFSRPFLVAPRPSRT